MGAGGVQREPRDGGAGSGGTDGAAQAPNRQPSLPRSETLQISLQCTTRSIMDARARLTMLGQGLRCTAARLCSTLFRRGLRLVPERRRPPGKDARAGRSRSVARCRQKRFDRGFAFCILLRQTATHRLRPACPSCPSCPSRLPMQRPTAGAPPLRRVRLRLVSLYVGETGCSCETLFTSLTAAAASLLPAAANPALHRLLALHRSQAAQDLPDQNSNVAGG